jgi:hypothetical protein
LAGAEKATAGWLDDMLGFPAERSASASSCLMRASSNATLCFRLLDRGRDIAFLGSASPLEGLRRRRRVVEIERDAHLGEHLVVSLEREQRLTEHDPSLDGGWTTEQSQSADLHGLLELSGRNQRLAPGDEVARRHSYGPSLPHPLPPRRIRASAGGPMSV